MKVSTFTILLSAGLLATVLAVRSARQAEQQSSLEPQPTEAPAAEGAGAGAEGKPENPENQGSGNSGNSDNSGNPPTKPPQKNCISQDACYEDNDCNGGKCLLFLEGPPGKCNCGSCTLKNLFTCRDDSDCGGLKGACFKNETDSFWRNPKCNCAEGYSQAGLSKFTGMFELCGLTGKSCNGQNEKEVCAGLPCAKGRCVC